MASDSLLSLKESWRRNCSEATEIMRSLTACTAALVEAKRRTSDVLASAREAMIHAESVAGSPRAAADLPFPPAENAALAEPADSSEAASRDAAAEEFGRSD
ncbi:MAG TPA: hypothetical protein VFB32_05970 [Rudaea sp.]|nr:hypothetical protein [Rudaea sp.]